MSQTDTSRHPGNPNGEGGQARRGLGRLRRDTERGDRCQMCRQAVVVDASGRCPLGHQVIAADDMAGADSAGVDMAGADTSGATTRGEALELEIDLDRDLVPTAPLGFAHIGGGALPQRVVPRPLPSAPPVAQAEAVPTPDDDDLTRQLLARSAADRTTRWVPGVRPGGLRLETPTLLPDRANGRRLAQPDDRPLPVMEPTPPLPDPPPEDGPAVARALFHDALGDVAAPTDLRPPTAPATAEPVSEPEPFVIRVDPTPAPPSALGGWRAGATPDWVTAADLSPSAPSALDVPELPAASPRAEPVFEPEPIEAEVIASRGPAQWLAASLFVAALIAIAWYLATTL